MKHLLTFLLVVGLAASLLASVPQNRSQFRGRTDLVRLDVLVLDADRRPIRGLTTDDFSVLDNGVESPGVAMTEFDVPAAGAAGEPWLRDIAPDVATNTLADGRLFIIVLDDALMSASARSLATSKEAARAVIERLGPSDLAAVVYSNDGRKSQNFTSDRGKLLAAVDKLAPGFFGARTGADDAFSDEVYMRASIATLRQVAEVLASGPERRKALVYIGEGVPIDMTQATTQIGPAPGSDFLTGSVLMPVLIQEFQKLIRAAQRANAAVYTIDPIGLSPSRRQFENDYLRALAVNTGGLPIVDRNDFEPGVRQIFEENSAYYLVGYQPADPPRPGRFRPVDVRVRVPGAVVRARPGYFGEEEPDPEDPPDEAALLTDALTSLLPVGEMPMRVQVAPFPVPGRKDVALVVTAALSQPAPAERVTHRVELATTAFDVNGKSKASKRQTATLVLRPTGGDVQYEVVSRIDLRPGRYNLRFAGRNGALDRGGSVFQDVEVVELKDDRVALSGVVLSSDPAPQSAPRDALANLIPVIPTSLRDFTRSTAVTAFARLYVGRRMKPAAVDVVATLVDRSGGEVFRDRRVIEPGGLTKEGTADVRIELPLHLLDVGPHLLALAAAVVTDRPPIVRHVRFTVR